MTQRLLNLFRCCRIKEESMQELTFETILRLPQMDLKKH